MLSIIVPAVSLVALGLAYRRHRKGLVVKPDLTLMATVKRRRSLHRKLSRRLDGEMQVQALVRNEAKRLGVSPSSIEAMEAALMRLKGGEPSVLG